jgi:uncharacterized protein
MSTERTQKPPILGMLRSKAVTRMDEIIDVNVKKQHAREVLLKHRGVLVALSGGVDSAVLLAIACETLGTNVLAVTGRSAAVTEHEIADARRVAESLGASHSVVDTHEIDSLAYRANTGDRCFHCRSELFAVLSRTAAANGIDAIAYGAIVDDLGDDRPGMEAARQLGIIAPLLEARIGKSDVRLLAKQFNLHIHEKPASPCLASRIPIGTEVTRERLEQVGLAEAALQRLGFRVFRVRHHGNTARLEFGEGEAERLEDASTRANVVAAVERAGFHSVAMDLAGYRPGGAKVGGRSVVLHSIEPQRINGQ